MLSFKSYERGREKWQGETLEGVWFDEESPLDIYTEGLTRTNATGGITIMTCTPLLGMSEVVHAVPDRRRHGPAAEGEQEGRHEPHVTMMTIDDAEHYTPEERAAIIAAYPLHERDARARGIPVLGSGRVFPIAEEEISVIALPAATLLADGWERSTSAGTTPRPRSSWPTTPRATSSSSPNVTGRHSSRRPCRRSR